MRKITQRMLTILLLLLPVSCMEMLAQIVAGGVYNLVNVEKGEALSAPALDWVSVRPVNTNDYSQLWYAETTDNGRFALRNLANGLYLRSSKRASGPWSLVTSVDDNCKFYCVGSQNPFVINSNNNTDGSFCMHFDTGQGCVVCWSYDNANKSKWNISSVEISAEKLNENWQKVQELGEVTANAAKYQGALDALFSDKACTVLKNPAVDENDPNFKILPATLQRMVLKVKNGDWTEKNANPAKKNWDSDYAKKFRVQLYEPYCDPVEAAKAIKINAHANLNNPTGLYANFQQVLYVMVEGQIKPGAEVYLSTIVGHDKPSGNFRSGTKLQEGLNIIPYWADGNAALINYVVETFKNGEMTQYKLSQFPDLKIHIEGGYINGYYNVEGDALYKADKDADWNYYEERANLEDITILGKYQTLQFYLNAIGNDQGLSHYFTEHASVEKVMKEWDRIMYSERLTLGLLSEKEVQEANALYPTLDDPSRGIYAFIGKDKGFVDYSDSYRLHGLSLGTTHGYMYGSWEYSGYHINTFNGIIGEIAEAAGPTWGPAHEIGHQHQQLLNMNGLTEVSNNIFSNVAVWYNGKATSRVNGSNGCLASVLDAFNRENSDFFTNNIWAQTQMYYKLWMYYHLTGHNNKFFPRLFALLRQDPMIIGRDQDGTTSLMHFYKKCCEASGEDLTEFFRAYGFFSPMKDRYVDDYSPAVYNLTQEQIDAAIQEVKSKHYPVNHGAILINDGTDDVTYGHDGKTKRGLWDGSASADLGNYIGFYLGKENKVTQSYRLNLVGNTADMTGGKGGVGFLIYGMNNDLIAFSDRYSFKLSAEAQSALIKGQAKVYVANGDNTLTEVVDIQLNQKELLTTLLNEAAGILALQDATNTKVGFYHPEALNDLQRIYHETQKVLESGVESSFIGAYIVLSDELNKLKSNKWAKVQVEANTAYVLQNRNYTDYYMSVSGKKMVAELKSDNEAQQWYLESLGGDVFAIKNKATNTYLKELGRSVQQEADEATARVSYKMVEMENGYFAFTCQDKDGQSLHCDGGKHIVGWDAQSLPSQWRVVAVGSSELNKATAGLQSLIQQTSELMGKMAVVGNDMVLQTTHEDAPGFLYCNAPYTGNAYPNDYSSAENGYNLLDNDGNTYLHTDYSGKNSEDGLDHYLRVDLGSGIVASKFVMTYVTRNADSSERPKTMKVEGSNDNSNYTLITTLSDLPNQKAAKYEKEIVSTVPYRYLRFMVTETYKNDPKAGHAYFSMASFDLGFAEDIIVSVNAPYQDKAASIRAALAEMNSAKQVLDASQDITEINAASEKLQSALNVLRSVFDEANNAVLEARKAELQNLIDLTDALVQDCGTMQNVGQFKLQTTDASAMGYLSSNADQNDGGGQSDGEGIKALIDGNVATYFHTRWGGKVVNEAHYVQVDLGKDMTALNFNFSYATRQVPNDYADGTSPAPTRIKVMGSQDGVNFFEIQELTKEANHLPSYKESAKNWSSDDIKSDEPCRYIRFVVTESAGPRDTQYGGQYFFAMSEFGLNVLPAIVINKDYVEVTEQQWLNAYNGVLSAKTIVRLATEEQQVAEALKSLQLKYEVLLASKQASLQYVLKVSQFGYAGLYLPKNAMIPEGATAFVIKKVNSTSVNLAPIEEGVIPANTGVIIQANEGQYIFNYTDQPATAQSLLLGANSTVFIKGEPNMSNYLFGVMDGQVGLYKAWLEYNADGSQSAEINDTDKGGYFKVSAHKVYLPEVNSAANALSFVFDDLTGIENIEISSEDKIYDLSGRRLHEIQRPGLYIINGQKKYIVK